MESMDHEPLGCADGAFKEKQLSWLTMESRTTSLLPHFSVRNICYDEGSRGLDILWFYSKALAKVARYPLSLMKVAALLRRDRLRHSDHRMRQMILASTPIYCPPLGSFCNSTADETDG